MGDDRLTELDLDGFVADVQTRDPRIQVLDADGNAVDRGDITLRYSRDEIVCDGLLDGDRLFINGVLRYDNSGALARAKASARAYHERTCGCG